MKLLSLLSIRLIQLEKAAEAMGVGKSTVVSGLEISAENVIERKLKVHLYQKSDAKFQPLSE
ncbi:MAG: hypothetical protein ACJAUP_002082 [Cellvibrionaceae bacterium]|jgi:hypothetical protein